MVVSNDPLTLLVWVIIILIVVVILLKVLDRI
jgi:hypothetical protein